MNGISDNIKYTIIENNKYNALDNLIELSKCNYMILSNSTYSQWSAILGIKNNIYYPSTNNFIGSSTKINFVKYKEYVMKKEDVELYFVVKHI